MSSYRIGMNLRVTEDSNQGGRRYMEDKHAIRFVKNDEGGFEFAYFGIFDGHGGGEASKFARDYLLDEITKFDCFWSDNDDDILYAIKTAFLDTHFGMWKEVGKWPKTASGLPSTAGTTASIGIIKNSKLYIGHVGDSGIVLGYNDSKNDKIVRPKARILTKEHKPDDPEEKERIEGSGGQVVAKSGVQRVVWNRPRNNHKGPIRRSTPIDKIPFLAVARSLGDLWSYNYLKEQFVVSPEPDVSVHRLDPTTDKCLVIGSDGLWNMLTAEESVNMVMDMEYQFEYKVVNDPSVPVSYWINPAERLVQAALNKWRMRLMKADNTSAVVVLIDPLGPRKLSILKKKREERMKEVAERKFADNRSVTDMLTAKESLQKSPKKGKEKVSKLLPATKPESLTVKPVHLLRNEPITSSITSVTKPKERTSAHSALHKLTDNLDDSIQLRNAHLTTPITNGNETKTDLHLHRVKSVPSPHKTKTSPLQTSTSENVCRSGMATRSSPQKSPVTPHSHPLPVNAIKAKKELDNSNKAHVQSKESLRPSLMAGATHGQNKCLQPSKQAADNVKSKVPKDEKLKGLENIFSTDVKLSLRNLNIGKGQTVRSKNQNNSNVSDSGRSSKKAHSTKSLSSRISLRLRRIKLKSQRVMKNASQAENKGFVNAKTSLKRKMDSNFSDPPATKKLKHS